MSEINDPNVLIVTSTGLKTKSLAEWEEKIRGVRRIELDPLVLEYQRKIAAEYPQAEVDSAKLAVSTKDADIKTRYPKPTL